MCQSQTLEDQAMHIFHIYRYDPDRDTKPRMQSLELEIDDSERMLLDALLKLAK